MAVFVFDMDYINVNLRDYINVNLIKKATMTEFDGDFFAVWLYWF